MAQWIVSNTQKQGGYVYYDLLKDDETVLTHQHLGTISDHVDQHIRPGDTYQEPGFPVISYERYQEEREILRVADERERQRHLQ